MVISESKPMEEILASLAGHQSVFLVGCSECASVCQVGGEDQLKQMAVQLEASGKKVAGMLVAEPGCHQLKVKQDLRKQKEEVDGADCLLVMSCGNGVQTAAAVSAKPVHGATNTLFIGSVRRFGEFEEFCSACGDCLLDQTANICPITRCSKHLLNGPCGGTTAEGKCEVDAERDCAWMLIYKSMGEQGRLDNLIPFVEVRDSKPRPRALAVGKKEES